MSERQPCEAEGCINTYPPFWGRKTKLCRACNNRANSQAPEGREKRSKAMKYHYEDPSNRERTRQALKASLKVKMETDPTFSQIRSERAKACGLHQAAMNSPKMAKKSESRMRGGMKYRERFLGWCPVEYRADYKTLLRKAKMKSVDARRLIEDQIKRDAEAYRRTGQLQRKA